MENKAYFGSLSDRMRSFRESVLDKKPYIDAQRALLATEAYKNALNQPPVMKRALMLKNILEKMSIYIEDETLLVGNQASSNKDAPVFPEYTLKFIMEELDLLTHEPGIPYFEYVKKIKSNPLAKTVKLAHAENLTLKDACVKLGYLSAERFDEIFKPEEMV